MTGVYKITNLVNGKIYIGSAVDIKKRWRSHIFDLKRGRHANDYLQKAWNKHGRDSFFFEVLECCQPCDLISKEQHYIDAIKGRESCYNIALIAGSRLGVKQSPETIRKMREANLGKKASEEARRNMKIAAKGRKKQVITDEWRQNMSKATKRLWQDPVFREKMKNSGRGKFERSEETRKKLSLARLGKKNSRPFSEETRIKMSIVAKNRVFSPETRKKLSEQAIQQWQIHKLNNLTGHLKRGDYHG